MHYIIGATKFAIRTLFQLLDKLLQCQKDLLIDIRYCLGVLRKNKTELLPASASVVLETVLRFLLLVNEVNLGFKAKDR